MPEVELILVTKGGEELKTTLKAVQDNISKARKELDEFYKTQKKGFSDPKEMEEWNNKFKELNTTIADGEKILEQYTDQVGETAKEQNQQATQTDSLVGKVGKLAAQYLSVTLILNKLKTAFLETTQGMSLFNQVMAAMNQIIHNIVSGVGQWNHGVIEAIALAKKMSDVRVKDNIQMLQAKKLMQEYNKLYTEGIDATISSTDKISKLTQAKDKYLEAINLEIAGQKELLLIAYDQWKLQPDNLKAMQETYTIAGKIRDLLGQRESGTRRLTAAITGEEKEMFKGVSDAVNDMNKSIDKWEEEFLDDQKDRMAKVRAERQKSDDESKQALDQLYLYYRNQFFDYLDDIERAREKEKQAEWDFNSEIAKKLFKQNQELAEEQAKAAGLIGIDPESPEGREMLQDLKSAADKVLDIYADFTDGLVDDTQRRRELYDEQIAETQRSLELEMALMEEGFANNVTLKRKEIEQLKILRAEALKDEEEALRKQRIVESIIQGVNLATSVTQLLKEYTKIPIVGIALAGVAIGALFAMFTAAKSKAAATVKLAEGGTGTDTGIITGKSHKAGGEHFLSHIEVERGERWGVLSRKASDKFGKSFDQIVTSFNKGEMPIFGTPTYSNNVVVNNDGSNSRLDKVITEQKKLNKQFGGQQLQIVGNKKVITKGNKIRIIG